MWNGFCGRGQDVLNHAYREATKYVINPVSAAHCTTAKIRSSLKQFKLGGAHPSETSNVNEREFPGILRKLNLPAVESALKLLCQSTKALQTVPFTNDSHGQGVTVTARTAAAFQQYLCNLPSLPEVTLWFGMQCYGTRFVGGFAGKAMNLPIRTVEKIHSHFSFQLEW